MSVDVLFVAVLTKSCSDNNCQLVSFCYGTKLYMAASTEERERKRERKLENSSYVARNITVCEIGRVINNEDWYASIIAILMHARVWGVVPLNHHCVITSTATQHSFRL